MLVTGYRLKEAIKMTTLELNAVQSQFDGSLHVFKGEEDDSPFKISDRIKELELNVVDLQTAQDHYNLSVKIKVGKEIWQLARAIKAVGGAGRIAKMWRTAAYGKKTDSWDRQRSLTRNKDEEVAKPTVKKQEALEESRNAEKYASQLRNAIAIGNTDAIDIAWVTPELFA